MNFLCIVSCAFLIATAFGKPSTKHSTTEHYPYDYYEDPIEDSAPPDQSDDASLPPRFLIEPQVLVAKEGQSVMLHCPTENAESYVSLWQKDKVTITQGSISLNHDLYAVFKNNTLLVKHIKPSSVGYYTCVTVISATHNISLAHRLKLENAAEIVSLHAEKNVTQLYTGDTLILTCQVDGKPMPAIKWYFDRNDEEGAIEIPTDDHQSTGYRDTLIIKDVSFKNNGTYRCFADNKITADHQSIVIEVFDVPIYIEIEKHYGKNSELNSLDCIVRFNKSQVHDIVWNNENNFSTNYLQEKSNKSSKLIFENIQDIDFGTYICTAETSDGTINKTILVRPPTKPVFEVFLPSKEEKYNITLVWRVFSFYPIITCFVYDIIQDEYWPLPHVSLTIHEDDIDNYLILHPQYFPFNIAFAFKIICENAVGWSEKSDVQNFELTVDLLYIEIQKLYKHNDLIGLDCLLLLNKSEVNLSWKKDNKVYEDSLLDATFEHTQKLLALFFKDNSFVNSGMYVCVAKLPTSEERLEKFVLIEPPSIPIIINTFPSIIVWNVHSALSIIECKVKYGRVNAFGPLEHLDRRVNIRREEFYNYIVSYTPPQLLRGRYEFLLTCKNEDGWSERSELQTLQLEVTPTVRIEKIYSKSKTVTGLNCVVEANPLPNIFWKRNGEIITANRTMQRTKNSLKIVFDIVDETDFGKYTCIAKNFVDSAEKDVMFVKPLQPQFRGFGSLGNNRGDVLTWTVSSPEPIKYCVVYYKDENETGRSISATEIVKYGDGYLITHVPLVLNDGTYKFRVKCLGEGGWSDESQEKSLGIKDKGRDAATSDSQKSAGLRLVPSIMFLIATIVLMNP